MKKAKILSLLVVVLLVATVFASLAFTSSAATSQDPADAEDFLDVVWVDDSDHSKGFTLKGIEGGPWDEKYADPDVYPFVVATMPTADKGTANAKYTLVSDKYTKASTVYEDSTKANIEYAKNDIKGFTKYLMGVTTGAVGAAKDTLKTANLYTWEKDGDALTGKGQYNADSLDAYIFFRRDYSLQRVYTTSVTNETYGNLSQVQGNLYIDMLGNTLTSGDNITASYIFYMQCKAWGDSNGVPGGGAGDANAFPSYFTIRNGTVSTYKTEVVRFASQKQGTATYAAQMVYATKSFTFDNVDFKLEEGATASNWFATAGVSGGVIVPVELNINDCTFDARNATASTFTLLSPNFNVENDDGVEYANMTAQVRVNGAKITANSISQIQLSEFGTTDENGVNGDDTLIYGKGSDGKYIELTVSNDHVALTDTFKPSKAKLYNESGERLGLICTAIDNSTKTYTLEKITANTFEFNGVDVSIDYYSALEYPFIVIKDNGAGTLSYNASMFFAQKLVADTTNGAPANAKKTSTSGGAMGYAKDYISNYNIWTGEKFTGNDGSDTVYTATIYLRRDYNRYVYNYTNAKDKATTTYESYDNVAQIQGVLTIDLGGHTFYDAPNQTTLSLLSGSMKPWKDVASTQTSDNDLCPVTVEVKNGNIALYERPLISFGTSLDANDNAVTGKKLTYNFNNVNFSVDGGAGNIITKGTIEENTTTGEKSVGYSAVNFNDCTIDLENATASEFYIARLGNKYTNTKISIKGGYINAGNVNFKMNYFDKTDASEIAGIFLLKDENGAYTPIYSSKSDLSESDMTALRSGLTYVAASTDGTTTTYLPIPTAVLNLEFTPMTSITLDSDLIFNIYIPANSTATIEKVLVNDDVKMLGEATEDGYYVVSVPLKAKEAAKTLTLAVELDVDGEKVKGKFSFSTVKYVDALLDKEGVTEVEKTLAKDMLAYVKSAYNYFNSSDKAEVAEAIEAVIGSYTAALKRVDGANASDEKDIVAGTTFALDSTPAIRFYLHSGTDASQFSFKVGGKLVAAEDISTGVEAAAGDFNGYNYVDISLYAYRMIENVTITKGTDTATYHINYYYDNMDTSKTELVEMITAFYNYCASANEYRTEVTK